MTITFLTQEMLSSPAEKRYPSGLKGKVSLPSDFNAPLEDLKEYT